MKKFFTNHGTITRDQVQDIWSADCESASVVVNRQEYSLIDSGELKKFLAHTKIDRGIWRQFSPASDKPEWVCTSFALMLFGLMEQERLRCGIPFPFTFARVITFNHALNGFICRDLKLWIVEPQTDAICELNEWQARTPDNTVNHIQCV